MFKKFVLTTILAIGLLFFQSPLVFANAAVDSGCSAINQLSSTNNCTSTNNSLNSVIAKVVDVFSFIIGAVSVIVIMVAGFRFVTSGGDQNTTKSSRETILYAIVGLIVAVLAQLIVYLTLGSANSLL